MKLYVVGSLIRPSLVAVVIVKVYGVPEVNPAKLKSPVVLDTGILDVVFSPVFVFVRV